MEELRLLRFGPSSSKSNPLAGVTVERAVEEAGIATEEVTMEELLARVFDQEAQKCQAQITKEFDKAFAEVRLSTIQHARQRAIADGLSSAAADKAAQQEANRLLKVLDAPSVKEAKAAELAELAKAQEQAHELAKQFERGSERVAMPANKVPSYFAVEFRNGEKNIEARFAGQRWASYAPVVVGNSLELVTNRVLKTAQLQIAENIAAGKLPAGSTRWAQYKAALKGPKLTAGTLKKTFLSADAIKGLGCKFG